MSRRNNKSSSGPAAAAKGGSGGPPSSHPMELSVDHRGFLIRSLDRCDTEYAALVKLNRSLTHCRDAITATPGGASLLLDLGEGLLTLNATGDGLLVGGGDNNDSIKLLSSQEEQHSLCLDFLSRMKLRRRLLNRMARRLNRLSHSMDGTDVSPPVPPKYGDLRLHVDAKAVAEYADHWKRQEEARKRITLRKAGVLLTTTATTTTQDEEVSDDVSNKNNNKDDDATHNAKFVDGKDEKVQLPESSSDGTPAPSSTSSPKPDDETAPSAAAEAAKPEATADTPAGKPAAEASSDDPDPDAAPNPAAEESPTKESPTTATPAAAAAPDATISTEPKPDKVPTSDVDNESSTCAQDDYALIRDYNDAYEQTLDLMTHQRSFLRLDNDDCGDAALAITRHHGIGAATRGTSMTMREKQVELQRWKTALLTKIPDQPSAADLGLTHRVFGLEERRKVILIQEEEKEKALLEEKEKDDSDDDDDSDDEDVDMSEEDDDDDEMKDVEKKGKSSKRKDSDSEDDESKDSEEEEEKEDSDDKEDEDDDDDSEHEDKMDEDKKEEDDDEKKEDTKKEEDEKENKKQQQPSEDLSIPKRVKPMSLLPIPSFYEQDLKRMRLIHADLMATSIHEHARRRLAEVTNDYNHAFRSSNELYSQRVKLQTDVNTISHQHRMEISKVKNEYTMQATIARARWQKSKETWEIQKAKKAVQGMFGQMPMGTNRTQNASRHPNQILNTVGLSLGRIVDAVVLKVEGGAMNDREKFEDFVAPPAPDFNGIVINKATGETYGQRSQRVETTARQQMQHLTARLQQSEEDRKRAWKRLMKTKAEFEMPLSGRRRLDPNQASQIPLPPLRASTVIPQSSTPYQPAPVPAYVPPAINRGPAHPQHHDLSNNPLLSASESKYSAARVRERISSDGTVRPVAEPKRDKDGLFMRPAGRTRKGMNWDAVRGIWVPGLR
mmetsp:Transcript_24280/g.40231  ORF Transcript_24280/g.40231 Transcript_24280/m.40231 type:complete len:951 (-) Transcript_24280:88-2940(-)|eukprot:CAMPEP_0119029700 /NCGR_PEP_ID=MMETSP1176-20130426/40653_1 /TAXON_ID=265551 /ORGANISM="Synedropsis recta cf, Strain CCMP1620" /LENGTH=950 /DNA_ID=CAMNT_0006986051 /DNA_START=42 /DNA_END=2894 /DNA_ORIENTATION=-